jgi:hypothetical protein
MQFSTIECRECSALFSPRPFGAALLRGASTQSRARQDWEDATTASVPRGFTVPDSVSVLDRPNRSDRERRTRLEAR